MKPLCVSVPLWETVPRILRSPMIKSFIFLNALVGLGTLAHVQGNIHVYEIPAISSVRHLPDKISPQARRDTPLQITATPGEFEPASFLVEAKSGIEKFEVKAEALKSAKGTTISADAIDVRIVKGWYQAGTAWFSYFADPTRREFVPELLLHDETLVKVDREKQENYLRVGNEYRWVSYPKDAATEFFNYLEEPVSDAPKLLPVAIPKGENRQFWVTLKVPDDAQAGVYTGKLEFTADGNPAGNLGLRVRVLPFKLPTPMTYYNLENEYLVTIYATDVLDISRRLERDPEKAKAHQKAIYRNLLEHNVRNIQSLADINNRKDRDEARNEIRAELRLMKEVVVPMKPLLAAGWVFPSPGDDQREDMEERFRERIDDFVKTVKEEVGHDDIYLSTWDEATEARVKTFRGLTEYTQEQNMKIWMTTAEGSHFNLAGYAIDYANHGGWPQKEKAALWHAVGAKITSYAGPHTGPENPDLFRRWEGLARYKENYDGSFNYKYLNQLQPTNGERSKQNVWNDFINEDYRGFCMVYPTAESVIDTIAWEGFREGIDDVRYATLLKQEAQKAMESGNATARREAKKSLMWLELLDAHTADLNAVRQEMIEYILKIRKASNE